VLMCSPVRRHVRLATSHRLLKPGQARRLSNRRGRGSAPWSDSRAVSSAASMLTVGLSRLAAARWPRPQATWYGSMRAASATLRARPGAPQLVSTMRGAAVVPRRAGRLQAPLPRGPSCRGWDAHRRRSPRCLIPACRRHGLRHADRGRGRRSSANAQAPEAGRRPCGASQPVPCDPPADLRRSMRPSPSQARRAGPSPALPGRGSGLPHVPSASACACARAHPGSAPAHHAPGCASGCGRTDV